MSGSGPERLEVVAAIIRDAHDHVLLSQRPLDKHQGGCWEFPGGKKEAGESLHQALARELDEELGIRADTSTPFMTIDHDYPERSVRLYFREVTRWHGAPEGREGQPVAWHPLHSLAQLPFPPANQPILRALLLGDQVLVLPSPLPQGWRSAIQGAVLAGVRTIYARQLQDESLLVDVVRHCHDLGARVMVADNPQLATQVKADIFHFTGASLGNDAVMAPATMWCSASCHDAVQLQQAAHRQVDFAFLSPVMATPSHADARPLGWDNFSRLATGLPFAVYALGGVGQQDLGRAREAGARGVAGIRGFWPQPKR